MRWLNFSSVTLFCQVRDNQWRPQDTISLFEKIGFHNACLFNLLRRDNKCMQAANNEFLSTFNLLSAQVSDLLAFCSHSVLNPGSFVGTICFYQKLQQHWYFFPP